MIIWFGGGLGNQLFQYALYRNAQYKGYNVKADLSYYNNYSCHNGFELTRLFNININECSKEEAKKNIYRYDILSRIIRKTISSSFGGNKNRITERCARYIDGLLTESNKDKYLYGYWQSVSYFYEVSDILRGEIVFPKLNNANQEIGSLIRSSKSVSIHVRRGDYLTSKIYCNLGESEYYNNAIKYISKKDDNLQFLIFSDDSEWCKKNLKLPSNSIFVDWNRKSDSYIDMQLISMCKYNIIANSSFSWWGAWLNSNNDKIVIAPNNWFSKDSLYDGTYIIPKDWVVLD